MHVCTSICSFLVHVLYFAVGTISFKQSTYSINENDDDPVRPVLVLSHPLSVDVTVQVETNDVTTKRKLVKYHT